VTVDDIAAEAGIRPRPHRFPGVAGRPLRGVRRRPADFTELGPRRSGRVLEDLLAYRGRGHPALRADEELQVMLSSRPGEVAMSLSFEGLPVIFETATAYLSPLVARWIGEQRAAELAELLSRLVLSYFLTPSRFVDLGDPESANRFIANHVLPAFSVHNPTA
jgi:hypothetical protein